MRNSVDRTPNSYTDKDNIDDEILLFIVKTRIAFGSS